ncbi:GNAT family N-acetyltransferase [Dyella sp. 2HG41-7]|uniref:GNAT family N-acetyltransferase n=1 Tax=Dyella sp. 2HG41-7 TaxID=2883239 RepID=UPI001F3365A0|nr:GNAT family N-acetyltransferase [Dyella sp. 2HG41-7]
MFSNLAYDLRSANTSALSEADYAHCYDTWGGSFIVHPDVLKYFENAHGIKVRYRGYFENGQCVGAVPTWGAFIAGDHSALSAQHLIDKVDFGYPAIYLPIDPQHRCTVLYKAKYLLNQQRSQIAGSLFVGGATKSMAILKRIPEELPTGKKEYEMKVRRFERQGGIVRDVQEFSDDDIAGIYTELFAQRWQRKPLGSDSLAETFSALKKFLFGKVLWLDEAPVAIQINFRADTRSTICIDYINGGVDKTLKRLSPGALLSYINGRNAWEESRQSGKLLIYSYGKSNAEYKNQWCNPVPRGLSGYWLP